MKLILSFAKWIDDYKYVLILGLIVFISFIMCHAYLA